MVYPSKALGRSGDLMLLCRSLTCAAFSRPRQYKHVDLSAARIRTGDNAMRKNFIPRPIVWSGWRSKIRPSRRSRSVRLSWLTLGSILGGQSWPNKLDLQGLLAKCTAFARRVSSHSVAKKSQQPKSGFAILFNPDRGRFGG